MPPLYPSAPNLHCILHCYTCLFGAVIGTDAVPFVFNAMQHLSVAVNIPNWASVSHHVQRYICSAVVL